MSQQTYLTCSLQERQYAIPTEAVREIFPLPELQVLPETPADILGTIDLRGQLLPIIHLGQRIAKLPPHCRVSDTVVVIAVGDRNVGLILDRVHEVCFIASEAIEQDLAFGRQGYTNAAFLTGVVQIDGENISILNPSALLRLSDEHIESVEPAEPINWVADFYERYLPTASGAERDLMHQRAQGLRPLIQESDVAQLIPLAVFNLSGEYFGLDLSFVREFITTQNIQPVPCSPPQIIGNMNLRGEIMTLVDLRPQLNLGKRDSSRTQAVVAQVGSLVAGIAIDELYDILYLRPAELALVPVANQASRAGAIHSTTPYRDRVLSVLDLPQLLNVA
jgi:purine-binding chemotaxis protein CheW